jgi:hypothetical protein
MSWARKADHDHGRLALAALQQECAGHAVPFPGLTGNRVWGINLGMKRVSIAISAIICG